MHGLLTDSGSQFRHFQLPLLDEHHMFQVFANLHRRCSTSTPSSLSSLASSLDYENGQTYRTHNPYLHYAILSLGGIPRLIHCLLFVLGSKKASETHISDDTGISTTTTSLDHLRFSRQLFTDRLKSLPSFKLYACVRLAFCITKERYQAYADRLQMMVHSKQVERLLLWATFGESTTRDAQVYTGCTVGELEIDGKVFVSHNRTAHIIDESASPSQDVFIIIPFIWLQTIRGTDSMQRFLPGFPLLGDISARLSYGGMEDFAI